MLIYHSLFQYIDTFSTSAFMNTMNSSTQKKFKKGKVKKTSLNLPSVITNVKKGGSLNKHMLTKHEDNVCKKCKE